MDRRTGVRLLGVALAAAAGLLAVARLTGDGGALGPAVALDPPGRVLRAPGVPPAELAPAAPADGRPDAPAPDAPASNAPETGGRSTPTEPATREAISAESSACRVTGVVIDMQDAPVEHATVELWVGEPGVGEPLARTRSGADGAFELAYAPPWAPADPGRPVGPGRPGPRVHLWAHLVGRSAVPPLWIASAPLPCELRRDFRVAIGAQVVGRVVDAAGAPVRATVRLVGRGPEGPETVAEMRASETGRYFLPFTRAGSYAVQASAGARGAARHDERWLDLSRIVQEPDLVLRVGEGRLAGRVVDPEGEPLRADLEVVSGTFRAAPGTRAAKVARAEGEPLAVGKHFARVRSARDGTFDVPGLVPGEAYTVEALVPGTGRRVAFGPFPDGLLDARIVLEAYRLVVRVTGVAEVRGVEVVARPEAGGSSRSARLAHDGTARLDVAPGTWHCVLSGRADAHGEALADVLPGRWVTECAIDAGAGGGATLVLALERPADVGRQHRVELAGHDAATGRLGWTARAGFGGETRVDVAPGAWIVVARGGYEGFHSEGYRPCRRWRVEAPAGVETPLPGTLECTGRLSVEMRAPRDVADAGLAAWLAQLAEDGARESPVLRERWGARVLVQHVPAPALAVAADREWHAVERRLPGKPLRKTPWPHDRFYPGDAPSWVEHPLEPGRWRVRVEARGCRTVEREVVIEPRADAALVVELEEAR